MQSESTVICEMKSDPKINEINEIIVIEREVGQAIYIGEQIKIVVLGSQGHEARIGIDAPKNMPIHREAEFYRRRHNGPRPGSIANNAITRPVTSQATSQATKSPKIIYKGRRLAKRPIQSRKIRPFYDLQLMMSRSPIPNREKFNFMLTEIEQSLDHEIQTELGRISQ